MKKFLTVFFVVIIANICFSAKSIDLPKHYKFPKNYFEGKHYDSVKDFFLIATEKIRDSRFEKTVILMLEHDEKGALGIVINKPLGKITLGSIISLKFTMVYILLALVHTQVLEFLEYCLQLKC